ncbi:UDP-rhamnose/UDP-galactose transporter 3 isoform X2 [Physcomitrium patens]|uniref:Sugar phosphate transporter domain-containing protein n=1 Tax=Physcomitrium patens TaxID=3218 RepID=A0A2K1KIR4_PHYPA|nr:UDP-rhamnose/UDP-galactose transporter 3-like isoform X2 [Physcomitrium patens]PNR53659.1 hypothetical protein PHYPA_007334 [Physcomitrium patens]|eukprot:XP_024376113.1 UDP-rhamnose/UDP-galactose transporter 3-like isoform X2 [Physcomitrella patens]
MNSLKGMSDKSDKKDEKKSGVTDMGAWAMNIISSVGIIMANKQVMSRSGYNYRFATSLTAFHFSVTAGVGYLSSALGYSVSKHVPFNDLFLFSLVSNTSIVGMNLSLMLNSVGFYQIAKLSMIPTVCVLEWLLHGKTYTREMKISVFVVMIGVGVCTVTDVNVNFKGFMAALIAVLSTSLQQIYIGALQKKHSCGSFELLSKTAPIQAASLLLIGPFVDYMLIGENLLSYSYSTGAIESTGQEHIARLDTNTFFLFLWWCWFFFLSLFISLFYTALHIVIVHTCCFLQCESILVHWKILSCDIPGVGTHEDCVRAALGMGSLRLCIDREEHDGHVHGCGRYDHVQLGRGSG